MTLILKYTALSHYFHCIGQEGKGLPEEQGQAPLDPGNLS